MKKTILLFATSCFLIVAALAQPPVIDETGGVKRISQLSTETNCTFTAKKDGLILKAILPTSVKDLNSIVLKLQLINASASVLMFKADNGLEGLNFDIINEQRQKLEATDYFKTRREGGLSYGSESVNPSTAVEIIVPLKKFIPITKLGKYTLVVDWADMEMGAIGWTRAAVPKIRLEGSFLLEKSGNDISIVRVK